MESPRAASDRISAQFDIVREVPLPPEVEGSRFVKVVTVPMVSTRPVNMILVLVLYSDSSGMRLQRIQRTIELKLRFTIVIESSTSFFSPLCRSPTSPSHISCCPTEFVYRDESNLATDDGSLHSVLHSKPKLIQWHEVFAKEPLPQIKVGGHCHVTYLCVERNARLVKQQLDLAVNGRR
jgi:hypothetical protein